jgi:hypothetical protein
MVQVHLRALVISSMLTSAFLVNTVHAQQPKPVKVEVKKIDNAYKLIRNGQPYFIKGAGGTSYMDRLAAYGGNSIRTWDSRNGDEVLNNAAKLGLTVTMGLNVARERHGFNYDDTAAVNQQA